MFAGCSLLPGQRGEEPSPPVVREQPPAEVAETARTVVPRNMPSADVFRTGVPYTVDGITYYPLNNADGYVQKGVASWYGTAFHGKETAIGEPFDMNRISAAHTTLPLPCTVRVTNLENGKELVLRVNDRGPFVKNRLIDLSMGAARELGYLNKGTAMVEVAVLEAPRGSITAWNEVSDKKAARNWIEETGRSTGVRPRLFIQTGAFQAFDNARRMLERLRPLGPAHIQRMQFKDSLFFRVRLGPVEDVEQADALVSNLASRGFGEGRVVVE
ncbi:MAG: septal ring lytic transglycosylase RlpA family protein [Magnetococcales bacterium]|nr:septal ring lytic transglycosylase RlpA family protein [Magnetococcales bacterium]